MYDVKYYPKRKIDSWVGSSLANCSSANNCFLFSIVDVFAFTIECIKSVCYN